MMKNHYAKKMVLKSRFEDAYSVLCNKTAGEIWEFIMKDMRNQNPYQVYTFLMYLISRTPLEAKWEYYAYTYLVYCNPIFDDSLRLAAWHLKRALTLDSSNVEYMKEVVSVFYTFSEQYFTMDEYSYMAKAILLVEPTNRACLNILETAKDQLA